MSNPQTTTRIAVDRLTDYINKLENILDAIHYGRDIPHQELFRARRAKEDRENFHERI